MLTPEKALAAAKAMQDMDLVRIPRGEIRDLLAELYRCRDGMKIEQARIHAETTVARVIAEYGKE